MRLVILALVLAGATAHAEPIDPAVQAKADALFEKAQAKYLADEFQGAIELFQQAYALVHDPVYLFNIAQSYRKVADCEGAFDYYSKYLEASPRAENRARVEAWLRELQPCVEQRRQEHEAARRGEEAERQRRIDEERLRQQRILAAQQVPRETEVDTGGTYRALGIAGIALGVAGVGAGVAYSLKGAGARDDLHALCTASCAWDDPAVQALDRQGRTDNTRARIGYLAGGITAALGIGLYAFGRTRVEHVMVMPTSGGAEVSAQLRF